MSFYLYRLKFVSSVHFGTLGIGLENTTERISSDALTSAIINAFSLIGEADEVVEALLGDMPPFVLSSLFPYGPVNGSKKIQYALPRPISDPQVLCNDVLRKIGKDLKMVNYIIPQDLCLWIQEESLTEDALNVILNRSKKLAKPWNKIDDTGWWAIDLHPRVALDRTSQNSNIWHCGTLHFADGAGLYGLVYFNDEEWKPRLATAFKLLGEMGLGGERTYGLGNFDFSEFEIPGLEWQTLINSQEISKNILLSLYYPLKDELLGLNGIFKSWDFVERKGYIVSGKNTTSFKRKRIWMFKEGSVANKHVKGCMVDVTPDNARVLGLNHNIYRSGLAFLLPFGGKQ